MRSIKQLTDEIFNDISYSKSSEELKNKVCNSIEKEYASLQAEGINEIQAMGVVMSRYGSAERAAELAGGALPENVSDIPKKRFEKTFNEVRLISLIIAWINTNMIFTAVQGIVLRGPWYIVTFLVNLLIAVVPCIIYKKVISPYNYNKVSLPPETRELFFLYKDRFKKRFINSIFLVAASIVYISASMMTAAVSGMTAAEIISVMNSHLIVPQIAILICIKNALYCHFLLCASPKEESADFRKYIFRLSLICFPFTAILVAVSAFIIDKDINVIILLYLAAAVFIAAGLVVNYRLRSVYMRANLHINKLRITAFAVSAVFLASLNYLRNDVYVLEPYITGVAEVPHTEHEIIYDDSSGVYTIKADGEDFKILHLTDIHLGGSVNSSYKDYKALEACRKLITHTSPDLVIVTGDLVFPMGIMSLSLNNEAPVRQFASFMRNLGIPWAFTYGNHDTESMATGSREEIGELYKSLSYKTSGSLLYPYVQPEITGRSNQLIKIENPDGTVRQALFLIDSNDYTGEGVNKYDYIHDDQVDWYARQVAELNRIQNETVPSMLFFHIPLQEYRTAYELYQSGSSEVEYHFGVIGETMISPVCCSEYPSRMFETASGLGSTQAMFCGHDHYNNLSVTYKGIRLTYGMSIDYLAMPGIDKDTDQRGGELITIHEDSSYDVEQIPLTSIE